MHSADGGCRGPLVVKLRFVPLRDLGVVEAQPGGKTTDAFCAVMDLVPTFLCVAGLQHPGAECQGRKFATLRGHSRVSFLETALLPGTELTNGAATQIHAPDYAVGFGIAGTGALLQGDFPRSLSFGSQGWELFNFKIDPGETNAPAESGTRKVQGAPGVMGRFTGMKSASWASAGEYKAVIQGKYSGVGAVDEFSDPYPWIKVHWTT